MVYFLELLSFVLISIEILKIIYQLNTNNVTIYPNELLFFVSVNFYELKKVKRMWTFYCLWQIPKWKNKFALKLCFNSYYNVLENVIDITKFYFIQIELNINFPILSKTFKLYLKFYSFMSDFMTFNHNCQQTSQ